MSEIRYACASLLASENVERKTLNLDFIIGESTQFNRITFALTQRGREYLANIPLEEKLNWPHHNTVYELWKDQRGGVRWIGKANVRQKFIPGKIKKTFRIERTGGILSFDQHANAYLFRCWIDDWHLEIILTETNVKQFAYKGEFRNDTIETSVKGKWV